MNIYHTLQEAICSDAIDVKERLTSVVMQALQDGTNIHQETFTPSCWLEPSYARRCTIVPPQALPARRDFDTPEGLAVLVHSIAHIEFSAIDLALDAVYRYPQMPIAYQYDWLEVASDEIRHFKMLEGLLGTLGFSYGDFPVHSGLFDAATNTAHCILERMAVIPRYFEASGLDVSPQIIKKLHNKRKNPHVATLIEILHIIYQEEIDHVLKGDRWFKYLCKEYGEDEEIFFQILAHYGLLSKHRAYVNVEARKEAGFSCEEIKKLGAKVCE